MATERVGEKAIRVLIVTVKAIGYLDRGQESRKIT